MASEAELTRAMMIRAQSMSEVPGGGPRRNAAPFVPVLMDGTPVASVSSGNGRSSEDHYEDLDEAPIEEPAARSKKGRRAPKAQKAAPPDPPTDGPEAMTIDVKVGTLSLKNVGVEGFSEGDEGCVLIAVGSGSQFAFDLDRGAEFSVVAGGESMNLYATGLGAEILGRRIMVFVRIPDDTE
jgi:hypothetical protein